jgi:FkbM family methyltransferase
MLDPEQIKKKATSYTWKGRITNPVRHLVVWPLIRPFFEAVDRGLDAEQMKKEATSYTWKGRITNPVRHLVVWPLIRPFFEAAAHKGRLRREYEVFHKDLIALRYRLASIEATLSDACEPLRRSKGLILCSQDYGCFLVRRPDVVGDAVADGLFWDEHLRSIIESCANRDGIAVDAGAYIGFHSVFMSRHFKTVHSFEPQRHIYHILRANLALNGCDNVIAHNQALYDHACHLRIAADNKQEIPITRKGNRIDYDTIANAAALTFEIADADSPNAVPAVTIDCLDLRNVAFIKIDAQGADFSILTGATHTIERWRPVVAFELERSLSSHHPKPDDVTQFFASLDYSLEVARSYEDGKQIDYIARPRRARMS